MIRIDEIYNHTFWPWIRRNLSLTRLFFCDPFGSTDPDDLKNFGDDVTELHYIFMHDQEPIHLDIHQALWNAVVERNRDLDGSNGPRFKGIIVSERDSEFVTAAVDRFGWQPYYYFFHGWAALDWYRGYDKCFLIPTPDQRQISRTIISPNRIIGGKRDQRVLLMYHLLKLKIRSAHISFPQGCPVEKSSIDTIAAKWTDHYPDMMSVMSQAGFPWHMAGETDHPMHSCWLSLFDQCAESLVYVVNETVYFGRRHHLTEKTFKPICLRMPFILVSAAGSLEYLRSYGFKTFGHIWSEDYDLETDDLQRMEKISKLIKSLDDLGQREKQELYKACMPTIEHNFQHFYGGNFSTLLWKEFTDMLQKIKRDHDRSSVR